MKRYILFIILVVAIIFCLNQIIIRTETKDYHSTITERDSMMVKTSGTK